MIQTWCIPAKQSATFVAAMEDIIAVYQRPCDPRRPLICFDETTTALRAHVRDPLPPLAGTPARIDTEYDHRGSAVLFLAVAPHMGWRMVQVTAQRRAREVAYVLRDVVDAFPDAEQIVLVLDNLNVHTAASLYRTFPPAEARRIWAKLEVHYTPVHGSWLNLAEPELSVLYRQCLDRRLGSCEEVEQEVAAWVAARNATAVPIQWTFSLADARTRLARTYPVLEEDTIR